MPVGIVPALIAAGGAVAGGVISANASKSAANTQAQSAAQALAVQSQIHDQTRADLMPYASTGVGALNTLRGLTGQPMQSVVTGPDGSASLRQLYNPYPNGNPNGQPNGPGSGYQPPQPGQFVPATHGMTYGTPTAQTGASARPASSGQLVTLQAPDGSTKQVPASQAAYYQQRGAKVVQ